MLKKWIIIASLILTINQPSYSLNQQEIIYHCPSIQDIKFENSTFTSTTHYNGTTMDWFTSQLFTGEKPKIKKFNFTNHYNQCTEGTCQIYCVYQLNNQDVLRFFVTNQRYRFLKAYSGPWTGRYCVAKDPDVCTFTAVPRN